MTREEMIAALDGEISRLENIKGLLAKSHSERFIFPEAARQAPIAAKKHGRARQKLESSAVAEAR